MPKLAWQMFKPRAEMQGGGIGGEYRGYVGIHWDILGICWDNVEENGSYYLGFRLASNVKASKPHPAKLEDI